MRLSTSNCWPGTSVFKGRHCPQDLGITPLHHQTSEGKYGELKPSFQQRTIGVVNCESVRWTVLHLECAEVGMYAMRFYVEETSGQEQVSP